MKSRRKLRLREALRQARRELADLQPIARAAVRYVTEIYAPNIREPFSISNRRMDLVDLVRAYEARLATATRRAA